MQVSSILPLTAINPSLESENINSQLETSLKEGDFSKAAECIRNGADAFYPFKPNFDLFESMLLSCGKDYYIFSEKNGFLCSCKKGEVDVSSLDSCIESVKVKLDKLRDALECETKGAICPQLTETKTQVLEQYESREPITAFLFAIMTQNQELLDALQSRNISLLDHTKFIEEGFSASEIIEYIVIALNPIHQELTVNFQLLEGLQKQLGALNLLEQLIDMGPGSFSNGLVKDYVRATLIDEAYREDSLELFEILLNSGQYDLLEGLAAKHPEFFLEYVEVIIEILKEEDESKAFKVQSTLKKQGIEL